MSDRTGANNVLAPEDRTFNAEVWATYTTNARKDRDKKLLSEYTKMAHGCMSEARDRLNYTADWTLPVDYCNVTVNSVRRSLEAANFQTELNTVFSRHALTISWRPQ